MDPWECYQDTWQTTCSVLEHHRDLMKVSWAGLWAGGPQQPGGPGKVDCPSCSRLIRQPWGDQL